MNKGGWCDGGTEKPSANEVSQRGSIFSGQAPHQLASLANSSLATFITLAAMHKNQLAGKGWRLSPPQRFKHLLHLLSANPPHPSKTLRLCRGEKGGGTPCSGWLVPNGIPSSDFRYNVCKRVRISQVWV